MRRENVANVVSAIVGWTPVRIGGETFEFSDKRAIELLVRPDMGWALEQIAKVQADDGIFAKVSA